MFPLEKKNSVTWSCFIYFSLCLFYFSSFAHLRTFPVRLLHFKSTELEDGRVRKESFNEPVLTFKWRWVRNDTMPGTFREQVVRPILRAPLSFILALLFFPDVTDFLPLEPSPIVALLIFPLVCLLGPLFEIHEDFLSLGCPVPRRAEQESVFCFLVVFFYTSLVLSLCLWTLH